MILGLLEGPHNGVPLYDLSHPPEKLIDSYIFLSKASFRVDRLQWLNQRPLRGWYK